MQTDRGSIDKKIACFLLTYRTTVNSATGEIPSVLMTGRRLRTRLDLVKPALKANHTVSGWKERIFEIGQTVWVRDYRSNQPKWVPGEIESKIGAVMFNVKVTTHGHGTATWKRHVDQLIARDRTSTEDPCPLPTPIASDDLILQQSREPIPANDSPLDNSPTTSVTPEPVAATLESSTSCSSTPEMATATTAITPSGTAKSTTRGRIVKMPAKFNDFVISQ